MQLSTIRFSNCRCQKSIDSRWRNTACSTSGYSKNSAHLGIEFFPAEPATDEQLLHAHTADYVYRVISGSLSDLEMRRIGFPWSKELVERSRCSTGATIQAAFAALDQRVAVNLAGGTHHAFSDRGQGYCVFNDVAVAARILQDHRFTNRVAVIDADVHQGNGTASIFADDHDVLTMSIHSERNFPFLKDKSDIDLPVPDKIRDDEYLAIFRGVLNEFHSTKFRSFFIWRAPTRTKMIVLDVCASRKKDCRLVTNSSLMLAGRIAFPLRLRWLVATRITWKISSTFITERSNSPLDFD